MKEPPDRPLRPADVRLGAQLMAGVLASMILIMALVPFLRG